MANHLALHSFTQSLRDYLAQRLATFVPIAPMPALPAAEVTVLSSSKFSSQDAISNPTISLFLHRISINNHLRSTRTGPAVGPLGVDLHFLLTIWADDADDELTLLAWAMKEIHFHAFLDRSSLTEEADWAVDEQINLVPADLPPEEMARIWETAHRGYRLSYPFIARGIRIGMEKSPDAAPVVATRFTYTDDLNQSVP